MGNSIRTVTVVEGLVQECESQYSTRTPTSITLKVQH